jgi:hypothetical protein
LKFAAGDGHAFQDLGPQAEGLVLRGAWPSIQPSSETAVALRRPHVSRRAKKNCMNAVSTGATSLDTAMWHWQLSDQDPRDSGFVLGDGPEDEETAAEIQRCRALTEKLRQMPTGSADESRTSP